MATLVILSNKMRYQKSAADPALAAIARGKKLPNRTDQLWGGIGGSLHAKTVRGECGVLSGTLWSE